MTHKSTGQLDFADAFLGNNRTLNRQLDKIRDRVDWKPFEELLSPIYSSPTGRPSHPVLLLFKALLLQTWHGLSDYVLEETLDDRLSFRRFVGLSASEKAPDHSVFSRFRDQLIQYGVHRRLFDELNRQLELRGLFVKKGTLVDATVIEAAPRKPPQNKDGTAGKSAVDGDADWTKKAGKYQFGYKAHLGVDQHSELIRRLEMTPAHVHDGRMLRQLVSGDERWVLADKAYDSKENSRMLREKGINNGVMMRGTRHRKLSRVEKMCNRVLSKLRCPVERIFGTMKRSYRYCRAKYLGLRKNLLQLTLTSMAYNLKRMGKVCA